MGPTLGPCRARMRPRQSLRRVAKVQMGREKLGGEPNSKAKEEEERHSANRSKEQDPVLISSVLGAHLGTKCTCQGWRDPGSFPSAPETSPVLQAGPSRTRSLSGGTHLEIHRARLGAELLQVLQVGFAQGIPQQGAARIAGRGLLPEGLVVGHLVGTVRPSPGGRLGVRSCTEGERMGSGPPGDQGDTLGPARSERRRQNHRRKREHSVPWGMPGEQAGRFCLRDLQPEKKNKKTNKNLSAFTQISLEKTKGSLMKFH